MSAVLRLHVYGLIWHDPHDHALLERRAEEVPVIDDMPDDLAELKQYVADQTTKITALEAEVKSIPARTRIRSPPIRTSFAPSIARPL